MKKIQNFYLFSYRLVGFVFLTGLISSILWYGFSILFFIGNASWSVPMILSPNQEKVMAHLEHVLAFEHEVIKNKAELIAAEQILHYKKKLLIANQQLVRRVTHSMTAQSKQYHKASLVFDQLNLEKRDNLNQLNTIAADIKNEEAVINHELKLGLITKQEALAAHLAWNKISANLIESKAYTYDLKRRSDDYNEAAHTLDGSGKNLNAMIKVIKKIELEGQIAKLKSDIFALEIKIKQLRNNRNKKKKVLAFMKNSPYILATKKPTTVAFVPYRNLPRVHLGKPVYSCYFDILLCYRSGKVTSIYGAEEYNTHPIFKSEIKGQLIGITFDYETDAQKKLLFLNRKPLLI